MMMMTKMSVNKMKHAVLHECMALLQWFFPMETLIAIWCSRSKHFNASMLFWHLWSKNSNGLTAMHCTASMSLWHLSIKMTKNSLRLYAASLSSSSAAVLPSITIVLLVLRTNPCNKSSCKVSLLISMRWTATHIDRDSIWRQQQLCQSHKQIIPWLHSEAYKRQTSPSNSHQGLHVVAHWNDLISKCHLADFQHFDIRQFYCDSQDKPAWQDRTCATQP